jgi:hypothetical protein
MRSIYVSIRSFVILGLTCAVVVFGMSSPAAAAANTSDSPNDTIGVNMWVYSRVTINNASLFQCPGTHCNQGIAQPPDPLTDFCYIPVETPWGGN